MRNAKMARYRSDCHPASQHLDGLVSVPSMRVMVLAVIADRQEFQVLKAVVSPIVIDVMDMLGPAQFPPEMRLIDMPMFRHLSASNGDEAVASAV
jgi:hypothetical protein